jgi:hypothetical protein
MGHAIGLASATQTRAVATKSGTNDTFNPATTPASKLWTYNNNGALWTEFDSGGVTGGPANFNGPQHFADLGQSTVVNGVTRSGAVALMNATGGNNRAMISDIEADCARWAYNYTIATPSSFGTMYDTLDADGTLRHQHHVAQRRRRVRQSKQRRDRHPSGRQQLAGDRQPQQSPAGHRSAEPDRQ